MEKLFKDIPEALENNYNFPKKFSFKPKNTKPVLPSLVLEKDKTAEEELLAQAQSGLNNRLKNFILLKKVLKGLLKKYIKTMSVRKISSVLESEHGLNVSKSSIPNLLKEIDFKKKEERNRRRRKSSMTETVWFSQSPKSHFQNQKSFLGFMWSEFGRTNRYIRNIIF